MPIERAPIVPADGERRRRRRRLVIRHGAATIGWLIGVATVVVAMIAWRGS